MIGLLNNRSGRREPATSPRGASGTRCSPHRSNRQRRLQLELQRVRETDRPQQPQFVLLEAAAGRLHVSNQQGNSVSVANSANHTLLGTVSLGGLVEPRGLALGIGPLVWGTAAGNNALYRFDPATRQLIGSPIALTGAGPEELAVVLYDTNAADHWKMFE